MPPRRTIHNDVPFVDPYRHETLEQRIRRLRPDFYLDTPPGLQAGEQPSSSSEPLPPGPTRQLPASARPSPYPPCTSNTITRRDAPVVCNTRRGSASDAIAALHERGGNALEAELRKDKVAQSSSAPVASLWKTWQGYHLQSMGPSVPVLPIIVATLVAIGSLFKAGRYRSFSNYVSVAKNQLSGDGPLASL